VSSITKKRSDFEHVLSGRESKPDHYVRYLEFEINLDSLKRKRRKRLAVKHVSYNGQRRIFFIFERATRKFPGDLDLWTRYLDYARDQKAHKRVGKIFTTVLRLHPTNAELWIQAARHASEDDIPAVRSYLQRGIRFCPKERRLWLELMRLEMLFIAKTTENIRMLGAKGRADSTEGDSATNALSAMASTPALTGGIPIAVFDAAMKEFHNEVILAEDMFDLVAEFSSLDACSRILEHILKFLDEHAPSNGCSFRSALLGVDPLSVEYPMALRTSIHSYRSFLASSSDPEHQSRLAQRVLWTFLPLSLVEETLPDLLDVVNAIIKECVALLGSDDKVQSVVSSLEERNRSEEAGHLIKMMDEESM
jgi:U3 small nucleolar RNA-associated protein 6